ncbi:PAS domain S-box protein [Salirhabdus salicampi]|uniref:PAS domain S-box protein n=1 Tax=Salirhabdus salicampi TaxID=476102 RepID=UPI0020C2976B|nr:PAS domain S-box protein [Salirhabdus salicampi]MCP8615700.1 PAS domain S-box protein [Salirhabdus salicampi]
MLSKIKNFKYLDFIFNNLSEMVFLIEVEQNETFTYVTTNEVAINTLSFPKDYSGKSIYDLMPKESADKITAKYKEAIQKRAPVKYKEKMLFPWRDGEQRIGWLESTSTPIFDDDGICTNIISVSREITEEVNNQRKIEQMNEHLELIYHNTADVIITFDAEGHFISVNNRFTEILGWTEQELLMDQSITIVPPEEREDFPSILSKLQKGEIIENHLSKRKAKNGRIIEMLASYAPVMENGVMVSGIAVYKDITSLRELEDRLSRTEERYRIIAEYSTDLIRILDEDGFIRYASPSHENILGVSPEFFVNKSILSFIHKEDMSKVQKWLEQINVSKEPTKIEHRKLTKKGEAIWFESIGVPVLDEKGELDQIVTITRDISIRKEQEEKLEKMALHDELTGLPNRILFQDRLEKALQTTARRGQMTALFALDCDNFKGINDTYGHDVGDEVLMEFSNRIVKSVREKDTVARMGGDEFQVILPEIENRQDAIHVADRIIAAMEQPFQIGERTLHISTSIGISFYGSKDTHKTMEMLVKEGDEALYVAKNEGKNTFAIYSKKKKASKKKSLKRLFTFKPKKR